MTKIRRVEGGVGSANRPRTDSPTADKDGDGAISNCFFHSCTHA